MSGKNQKKLFSVNPYYLTEGANYILIGDLMSGDLSSSSNDITIPDESDLEHFSEDEEIQLLMMDISDEDDSIELPDFIDDEEIPITEVCIDDPAELRLVTFHLKDDTLTIILPDFIGDDVIPISLICSDGCLPPSQQPKMCSDKEVEMFLERFLREVYENSNTSIDLFNELNLIIERFHDVSFCLWGWSQGIPRATL